MFIILPIMGFGGHFGKWPLHLFARVLKTPPSKILNLQVCITQISSQTILKTHCIQGYMAGPGLYGHRFQSVPTDSNLFPQF